MTRSVTGVKPGSKAQSKVGRIFRLGDDIDTDQLAPGRYMRGGIDALAAHCLESVRPDFAQSVQRGDILVAGRNFGMGSSREQAAEALRHLGLAGVVAESFAGIFYRNAINLGLPVLTTADSSAVKEGAAARLDVANGRLMLKEGGSLALDPLPDNLLPIIAAGGLVPLLKARFSKGAVT